MFKRINRLALTMFVLIISSSSLFAQEKQVVVSEVRTDMVAPEIEFVGTVFYQEVSDVASEVNGGVEEVLFEEGQIVKKGNILVKLSSDLLEKSIQAMNASYEQLLTDLEKAKRDYKRIESLYREDSVAEQVYDEHRFRVKGLEKRAQSLKAEVERLEVELRKKIIKASFDGVIIKKHVDRGEWLSPGSVVATVARDDIVDVLVEVPEGVIKSITPGMHVMVKSGGEEIKGKIFAIIPRGDVSTRTFPVKIRVKNTPSLMEGMEARVILPVGKTKRTLIVPRDAVITVFSKTVVFAVIDSKAKMISVKVVGYKGMMTGVYAEGLKEGMKVVVKGNERLSDGQMVNILNLDTDKH